MTACRPDAGLPPAFALLPTISLLTSPTARLRKLVALASHMIKELALGCEMIVADVAAVNLIVGTHVS